MLGHGLVEGFVLLEERVVPNILYADTILGSLL